MNNRYLDAIDAQGTEWGFGYGFGSSIFNRNINGNINNRSYSFEILKNMIPNNYRNITLYNDIITELKIERAHG